VGGTLCEGSCNSGSGGKLQERMESGWKHTLSPLNLVIIFGFHAINSSSSNFLLNKCVGEHVSPCTGLLRPAKY